MLLTLLTFVTFVSASLPANGLYRCINGNNQSICDQRVQVIAQGEIPFIQVIYAGYCNGQGPYRYACSEERVCTDGAIKITLQDGAHYTWENVSYGFKCEMEKM